MDTRSLIGTRPVGLRGQGLVSGQVSREQPAPATFADTLFVKIGSGDDVLPFPGGTWPQAHGTTLPVAGNPVLLGYDERGRLWVQTWQTVT